MQHRQCDTRAEVETPEGVLLTFDLAGPGSRMGAYLFDLMIRLAIIIALGYATGISALLFGEGASTGLMLVGLFLIEWSYGALFEGLWRGRTPGKSIFRLRVIKVAGYPIGFYDAVLRNFLRAADILPFCYGVGLIAMTATKRMQRIGDLAAGTIVVRAEEHRFQRDADAMRDALPIERSECAGVFAVSERTLDLIERLFGRQNSVGPRRLDEIGRHIAEPLAERLGFNLASINGGTPNTDFLRRVLRTFAHSEFENESRRTPRDEFDGRALERAQTSVQQPEVVA